MSASTILRAAALWNVFLAIGLLVPPLSAPLGLAVPGPFWGQMAAIFYLFTAAFAMLTATDLARFAPLAVWLGLLRTVTGLLLVLGGSGAFGPVLARAVGGVDLALGLLILWATLQGSRHGLAALLRARDR